MITAVNATNREAYKKLYQDAENYLCGYEQVFTYSPDTTYYYKANEEVNEFTEVNTITDVDSFALELNDKKKLFKKYGEPAEGYNKDNHITSLEEYFSYLRTLINTTSAYRTKYIVLPLDEPHFEINANTRAINIPSDFKKNGIAVQGDDLAETVYFEIDRYFDAMDFNNCEIYIQCELPKTKEQVIFPVTYKDITSQPGKLIFGWPISNKITLNSGALRFSVQFYQLEEDNGKVKIAYSFNTLIASVNIQTSIGIDVTSEKVTEDEIGDRLFDRIKDSQVAGNIGAEKPTLYYDFDEEEYDLDDNREYKLYVQGTSADTGAISYRWKRYGLDVENNINDSKIDPISQDLIKVDYLPIEHEDMVVNKTYWYNNGTTDEPQWLSYVGVPDVEDIKDYYEKVSSYTVTSTGNLKAPAAYKVVVTNRVSNSSVTEDSKFAKFPGPLTPKVDGGVKTANNGILKDGEDILSIVASTVSPKEKITYNWEKSDKYGLNENQEGATITSVGNDAATCTVDEPGRYRVIVSSSRNGESKSAEATDWVRVTNPAAEPVVIDDGEVNSKIFDYNAFTTDPETTQYLTINLDSSIESDGYIVEWYVYEGSNYRGLVTTETLAPGVCISKFNPLDYTEVISKITGQDNISAWYWAKITNSVNGDSISTGEITNTDDMFQVLPEPIIEPESDPILEESEEESLFFDEDLT